MRPRRPIPPPRRRPRKWVASWLGAAALLFLALPAAAQTTQPAAGRPVAEVGVVGNQTVSDSEILNAVRTEAGQPFDAQTVREDYQRIYNLRRFSRVEARYEEIPGGVIVVFDVQEQPALTRVRFRGNRRFDDETLRRLVEFETNRSVDPIMLAWAQSAIEELYRSRNHALAEVRLIRDEEAGTITFDIIEGPRVRVRNIDFVGADSFPELPLLASPLRKQIATTIYWPFGLFGRDGEYDPRRVEEDVASIQRYYRERGFFDARVGRRVVFSPDLTEVQIEFLIEEGPRYVINEIRFEGNERLTDGQLLDSIRLRPGMLYDRRDVQRAERSIIEAYSPFGLIYAEQIPGVVPDPDYLRIQEAQVFKLEPGKLDLVFNISEGLPFRVGNIEIRGNTKTQDKVLLREFDLAPGELYDSAAVQQGYRRLLASRYFERLSISPVGDEPGVRDILIEVDEQSTAMLTFGGAVSSNGGLIGTIKYEQRNFDLTDWPERPGDIIRGSAFTGAGQTFRVLLEPGTERSNATITFFEPYLLDQNLGFGTDAYWRSYRRREFQERHAGGRIRFSPRFGRNWRTGLSIRGEDVEIYDLDDPISDRAPEYIEFEGNTTISSLGADVGYRNVDNLLLPARGLDASIGWESFGVLGGPPFQKLTASFTGYVPLYRDLTDRPTVLELRLDSGFIYEDAPFFERFYGGGSGSIRGFRYRGVSPRSGPSDDPVGGDFNFTGSLSLGFPLYGESVRGVVFNDFGTVESDLEFGTIRTSLGFGFRFSFEGLGNIPIALDFAWPLNERPEDDEQFFSFSLGIIP